jgi:ubiquinone/menaquinone biosynthesis C-methylase UbiE
MGAMNIYKQTLGRMCGGRVLDVATGEGKFIKTLVENLGSYAEVVGIDTIQHKEAAGGIFSAENVHFTQMDAGRLGFRDESFDIVSISSSLHHLEDVPRSLAEIKRVLRTGGHFIIRETHRDVQSQPQLTDMYIHHWVAEVDSALGFTHNRTFARQELVDLVEGLGLWNVVFHDVSNTDLDPMDKAAITESEDIIDRYIRHAEGLSACDRLKSRGEQLRRRLYKVGVQWEPELIVIGERR